MDFCGQCGKSHDSRGFWLVPYKKTTPALETINAYSIMAITEA
jgi:hypothetical protein